MPILKEKIGCCNNLDDKILYSIFNWLQQPIFVCSEFLVPLVIHNVNILYDFDRLMQPKIGCCSQLKMSHLVNLFFQCNRCISLNKFFINTIFNIFIIS